MASKSSLLAVAAVAGLGLGTALLLSQKPAVPPAPVSQEPKVEALSKEAFDFQVLAHSDAADRVLDDGDTLAPTEQLRLRARSTVAGYVLVARIDRLGGVHLAYPSGQGARAARIKANPTLQELGQTIERLAGEEHLVAVFCSRPFVFDSVRDRVRVDRADEPALPGCLQVSHRLLGE